MLLAILSLVLPCAVGALRGARSRHPLYMQEAVVARSTDTFCDPESIVVTNESGCSLSLERLEVRRHKVPRLLPGHALVRNFATSINPTDWEAFINPRDEYPYGIGHDFSGVVVSSKGECGFEAEDKVWGVCDSAFQEYVVVKCNEMGRKPSKFGTVEAGAAGVVTMAGYTALKWAGGPWNNTPTVLVLGGSGGTGHVGIQLAKALGAGKVITTCSPANFAFVKAVGADEAIDYHDTEWWGKLDKGSVDIVYDCVGEAGTGDRAYQVLGGGGKFVTLQKEALVDEAAASSPSVQQKLVDGFDRETRHYDEVSKIVEEGKLRISVFRMYEGLTNSSVRQLFNASMLRHSVGKFALRITHDTFGTPEPPRPLWDQPHPVRPAPPIS